jgi:hypothetical protein
MDGYGYIYVTQQSQGTIKRIAFYGNVSVHASEAGKCTTSHFHACRASQSLEALLAVFTMMAQAQRPLSVTLKLWLSTRRARSCVSHAGGQTGLIAREGLHDSSLMLMPRLMHLLALLLSFLAPSFSH